MLKKNTKKAPMESEREKKKTKKCQMTRRLENRASETTKAKENVKKYYAKRFLQLFKALEARLALECFECWKEHWRLLRMLE